jgi:hypothetical protein
MPGAFISCLGGGDRSPIRLPPPPRPEAYRSNGHHLARAPPPPLPSRPTQEYLVPHDGGAEEQQQHHAAAHPAVSTATAGPVNASAPQHAAPEPEYPVQAPPLPCPVNWTRKELLGAGAFGQVGEGCPDARVRTHARMDTHGHAARVALWHGLPPPLML